eukprot:gnl/Carplike_NY0171/9305_a12985_143.p1 GENE.gnl/Carplike_NY0171/9305_a12985_143~~gnl/Carplike_NY0171/9305_a12985_143.p1  ORF type:complete len:267 (-),score=28.45 gnl/Carplike_NY0171/9305_a12985_143:41-841(-)
MQIFLPLIRLSHAQLVELSKDKKKLHSVLSELFRESLSTIDSKRLGKQRIEARQIRDCVLRMNEIETNPSLILIFIKSQILDLLKKVAKMNQSVFEPFVFKFEYFTEHLKQIKVTFFGNIGESTERHSGRPSKRRGKGVTDHDTTEKKKMTQTFINSFSNLVISADLYCKIMEWKSGPKTSKCEFLLNEWRKLPFPIKKEFGISWCAHPIIHMFRAHLECLTIYFNASIDEWMSRTTKAGKPMKNTMEKYEVNESLLTIPPWRGER